MVILQADGKPVWGDDIDLGDISLDDEAGPSSFVSSLPEKKSKKQLKKEARKKAKATAAAAEDGVDIEMMDADALPEEDGNEFGEDGDEWDGTEEMRKRKLDEYMNELYGLEFNDIVRPIFFTSSPQLSLVLRMLNNLLRSTD